MPYDPTIWQTGDVITAEKLNKIEQALVDLYEKVEGDVPAGYVVVAPEQSITVTSEDIDGVAVTLADGIPAISGTPYWPWTDYIAGNWIVEVNGVQCEFSHHSEMTPIYTMTDDNGAYGVFVEGFTLLFGAFTLDYETTIPGTYTVSIYAPEEEPVPEGYTAVAPKQIVMLTDTDASITVVDTYTLPAVLPNDWIVKVDGVQLEYGDPGSGDNIYYKLSNNIATYVVLDNYHLIFGVSESWSGIIPGTHTVVIYAPEESGGEEK